MRDAPEPKLKKCVRLLHTVGRSCRHGLVVGGPTAAPRECCTCQRSSTSETLALPSMAWTVLEQPVLLDAAGVCRVSNGGTGLVVDRCRVRRPEAVHDTSRWKKRGFGIRRHGRNRIGNAVGKQDALLPHHPVDPAGCDRWFG